jgi:hypothetical protein
MRPRDVGELTAALDNPGNRAPVFVASRPRGSSAVLTRLEVAVEHRVDPETKERFEIVVIYPVPGERGDT